ncbi:MAG: APC family permease [Blastocatellia bacterium]|nr:APC family permease [Blastocatellia bacterium]MCS7157071.1 APC family permease [Blastocatellia bacterium]MDW8167764.1 APC family permease [Acidobacteriota bacterium]MDW8256585.1 APC family permease [Acidobacteriota bacterium]
MDDLQMLSQRPRLRREVTLWGSFTWGYADVGADVYVALGLVMAAAQGATPLAFAIAGVVYVMVGLAYTELAATYPSAGGGQYFTLRGLGDFWGLVAGAALMLDYTVDVALFAMASAGYINFFFPRFREFSVSLGPFSEVNLVWLAETTGLIALLAILNVKGIRESSLFNEVLGALDLLMETSIIVLGFTFAWRPEFFLHQWRMEFPAWHDLLYGVSIAVISYVGLESISQAAQETVRPGTVIPRTSLTLIGVVLLFALAFPTVALGIAPWSEIAAREGDPVALLASKLPLVGFLAGPLAAVLAATIVLISANTGIMGASRLAFSMAELGLIGERLAHVHPRFRTPTRAILFFSGVAMVEALFAFLSGHKAMETMANMYAFGAMLAYFLSSLALLALRIREPHVPRPYMVPLNARVKETRIPLLGLLGLLGTGGMVALVLWTHKIARIVGPLWILVWILYYAFFRWRRSRPIFGSLPRDWDSEHRRLLEEAEEWDLLAWFQAEQGRRAKRRVDDGC